MAVPFFCESCAGIDNTGELSEANMHLLVVEIEFFFLMNQYFGYFPGLSDLLYDVIMHGGLVII